MARDQPRVLPGDRWRIQGGSIPKSPGSHRGTPQAVVGCYIALLRLPQLNMTDGRHVASGHYLQEQDVDLATSKRSQRPG